MSTFDWRSSSPADIDHEYSPSRHARRPLDEHMAEYARRSAGVEPASLVTPGAPLLVYIHGGYWQQLSAAESLFNAADAVRHGVSLHAVDYDLAPRATIEGIIAQCTRDIAVTVERLRPSRTVLAGCSAGAHIAAMCARVPEIAAAVDGLALLSGIYDLRPLVVTPTNDALGLDADRAALLSPMLLEPPPVRAALCAVGRHESSEFIRQNAEFARRLTSAAPGVVDAVVDERDHFDLPYDLLSAGTTVGDWVLDVLEVR
ncbi:MAG: alpha/beta hydrolase [Ilumatobacteraceae bacterium]